MGEMRPIRPMVTAAFSLKLRGLRGLHKMGTSRSMTGATKGSNCEAERGPGECQQDESTSDEMRTVYHLERIARRSLLQPK